MREYFHDTQQQVLFTPAKDIVLCAGRGWGKGPIHAAINLRNMQRFVGSDPAGKVSLLMDHTARPGDVADPLYTGDFDATWRDVTEGCAALLEELKNKI